MALPFEGKVAVVTGSSRGIGKAIAFELAKDGADVVISGRAEQPLPDRAGWSLVEAVEALRPAGRRVIAIRADVTQPDDLQALIDGTLKEFGRIDILVNNAGMLGGGAPFIGGDPAQIDQFYAANLRAPYVLSQLAAGHMAKAGGGTIVSITSGGARLSPPQGDTPWTGTGRVGYAYGITKAGLDKFANSVAAELKASNIAIFNVDPGLTITERNQLFNRGVDYSRANSTEVTGKAVAFLCRSPMAYTGRILVAREVYDQNRLGERDPAPSAGQSLN